jgi:hypothetical protein
MNPPVVHFEFEGCKLTGMNSDIIGARRSVQRSSWPPTTPHSELRNFRDTDNPVEMLLQIQMPSLTCTFHGRAEALSSH